MAVEEECERLSKTRSPRLRASPPCPLSSLAKVCLRSTSISSSALAFYSRLPPAGILVFFQPVQAMCSTPEVNGG